MAASTTIGRRTSVWGLGEIALRVNNLDAMQKFYEEVIGLPLMTRVPNCAFFKIADATAVTPKYSPCSTAHGAPAIAGRTQQPPPSTTSRSR
jgi:catechol 2,3-dioxygenase-like lactoylglutathione lyase family enzyme